MNKCALCRFSTHARVREMPSGKVAAHLLQCTKNWSAQKLAKVQKLLD